MGHNLIEFNGLPGCGKTTIADLLVNLLTNNGYVVFNEKNIYESKCLIIKIFDFFRAIITVKHFRFNYIVFCLGIIVYFKRKNLSIFRKTFKIVRYNWLLNRKIEQESFDFLITSEGYVQFLCSLVDGIEFSEGRIVSKLFHEISKIFESFLVVECYIDTAYSFERIRIRNLIANSVDRMTDSELIQFLKNRCANMTEIRKHYQGVIQCVKLDMLLSKDENLMALVPWIIRGDGMHAFKK